MLVQPARRSRLIARVGIVAGPGARNRSAPGGGPRRRSGPGRSARGSRSASGRGCGPDARVGVAGGKVATVLAKHLRGERPDYAYLKEVFRHLRAELDIEVVTAPVRLPYVPTEQEIRRYYQTV